MIFEKQWHDGVRRVAEVFELLTEPELEVLRTLCLSMMERKEALQKIAASVDAASHCALCGGACCVKGKYHFTAVDLLAYLVTGETLFAPLFGNGLCPYLSHDRCLMPPGYRPFNCITFNCEKIEDLLPRGEVARFYQLEKALREDYAKIRSVFPSKTMDGPLLREKP